MLQRSVVMRDSPGFAARPNYNKKPLLTQTMQNLQQGTVDVKFTPLQYYSASSPSSANLNNLNDNLQRHRIAENQRQIHDRIRATTENKQDDECNQQQSIIAPLDVQDGSHKGQENYQYFKIIISPEDLRKIEKYSYDPQKLRQTKSEEINVPENQAQTFQKPKIDGNNLPLSQTQQRMTSPSHFSVMEMQNQKMISIQEPQKMMMQQPNEMISIQEPQKMMMRKPNEMISIQEPQKMMMRQPNEMTSIQEPQKMMIQQPNEMISIQEPQKMMMRQPNEMISIQKPQKAIMRQPNGMRKQEMEEPQEVHKQMVKETQIPEAVDILREMGIPREKATKISRQEAATMEKEKETERRRQQIADKISETVYRQMLDLLGHLTGDAASQTEVKANPSAVIYQPLVVMQIQEDAGMRKQPAAGSQTEAEMGTQKQKLMIMLLQQMAEMQKQNTVNLQEKMSIQTRNAMELLRQQAMGMKIPSATDRQVPLEMEELEQGLMQMLAEKLVEMQRQQAKPMMNLQKQMSLKQEEKTESQKPPSDMEMQMIQVMEVLLQNIIEMRKQQLNEQQERMGVKMRKQNVTSMSLQKAADMSTRDKIKTRPQSTVSSQTPMQIEVPRRKVTGELPQQTHGMQRPETVEMLIRQTVGEVSQQMPKMQNQHLLKIQDGDTSSPNTAVQTVSDNSAKEQPENTERDRNAPDSEGETIGYQQVLIHIPHMLTKHPRNFPQQNNRRSTERATSLSSDTDRNANVDLSTSAERLSHPRISGRETSAQPDLESSEGSASPNTRLIPVINLPVESKSYNNYDFRQSPVSSNGPTIYESPSLHDPLFLESGTVFRSNLYSYDDLSLYGRDQSLIEDLPQPYKD